MKDYTKATARQHQDPARARLKPGDEVFVTRKYGYNNIYDRKTVSRVTSASVFVHAQVYSHETGGYAKGERRFNIDDGYEWGSGKERWRNRSRLFAMTPLMVAYVEQWEADREHERWHKVTVRTLSDYRYSNVSDETLRAILALLEAEEAESTDKE